MPQSLTVLTYNFSLHGAAVVIVAVWWFWPARGEVPPPQFADTPTIGK